MNIITDGDPDEVHRQIQMIATDRQARFFRLMEEMSPENLAVFMEILNGIIHFENGGFLAARLIGQGSAIMRLKHDDACMGCGNRHDLEMIEKTEAEMAREREVADPALQATLDEYFLEVRQPGNLLFCKGCGIEYASLNDRMLRPPGQDGCHGCKHKAAWG